jgi:hypothetical protein
MARMGEFRNVHRFFVEKPDGKESFGRPWRRWEDNNRKVGRVMQSYSTV